jgi:hypothetical protein
MMEIGDLTKKAYPPNRYALGYSKLVKEFWTTENVKI